MINSICLSPDSRRAVTASDDKTIRLWELDWEFTLAQDVDLDERIRPHLIQFMICRMPYVGQPTETESITEKEITNALTRRGLPAWTNQDFDMLLCDLAFAGYGYVRSEVIRCELENMTREWNAWILPEL
jgi:hypothetical protein